MLITMLQNVALDWSRCSIVGLGFLLLFRLTRTFDLAFAGAIALAPYIFLSLWGNPFSVVLSALVTVTVCIALGITLELLIYRRLRMGANGSSSILLASLGILVVIQNLISIIWGDAVHVLVKHTSSKIQLATVGSMNIPFLVSLIVAPLVLLVAFGTLHRTKLGLEWRSASCNIGLAQVVGIRATELFVIFTGASYGIAAISGLLIAWDLNAVPSMGFSPMMIGVVAAIIGRHQIGRLATAALLLAVCRNLIAWLFGAAWGEPFTFAILCGVLLFSPHGKQLLRGLKSTTG